VRPELAGRTDIVAGSLHTGPPIATTCCGQSVGMWRLAAVRPRPFGAGGARSEQTGDAES